MPNKNFTQFDLRSPVLTSDYIVGYSTENVPVEYKANLKDIVKLVAQSVSFDEQDKLLKFSTGEYVDLINLSDTAFSVLSSTLATVEQLEDTASILVPLSLYQQASSNWQTTYNTVCALSASWEESADIVPIVQNYLGTSYVYISSLFVSELIAGSVSDNQIRSLTGDWQGTFTTVQTNSAQWAMDSTTDTGVRELTSNWQNISTVVQSNSAQWATDSTTDTGVRALTGDWQGTYTIVRSNSASWEESADIIPIVTNYLSANSVTLQNVLLSSLTVTGTLSTLNEGNSTEWKQAYNLGTAYQTASSSFATNTTLDSVSSLLTPLVTTQAVTAAAIAENKAYNHSNFFPLTGGIISGPTRINNDLTVFGNLTATGIITYANTTYTGTSALSVVHFGSGPALFVSNTGDGDLATFYDADENIEVLHVGGINGTFPNVGIKTSQPNKTLTVNGEISANNTIYDSVGNSTQWNESYIIATTYQNTSGSFATNTTVNSVSSDLTPLTLTSTLTSQLVKNTDFDSYKTSVASSTASNITYAHTNFLSLSDISSSVSNVEFPKIKLNASITITPTLDPDVGEFYYNNSDSKLIFNINSTTRSVVFNTDLNSYATTVANATATLLPTTVYQTASSSFATNTLVNSVSGLLTPLATTNTLTGLLVTNTAFTDYQTSVANATATLLPTTTYQTASGSFASTTLLNSVSSLLVTNTNFNNYQTNVANATATLLPTTVYQTASSSFVQQNGNSLGTKLVIGTNDNNSLGLETNGVERLTITNLGTLSATNFSTVIASVNNQLYFSSNDEGQYFGGVKLTPNNTRILNVGSAWTASAGAPTWSSSDLVQAKLAMSSDGKNRTFVSPLRNVFISGDYGITWTARDSQRSWVGVAMSSDARTQTATVSGGFIYVSQDYGITWSSRHISGPWGDVAVSSDARYQLMAPVSAIGLLHTSSDFGSTWSPVSYGGTNWGRVAISSDGKYQTATTSTSIHTSDNYGLTGSWKQSLGFVAVNVITGLAMSSDGRIQTIVTYGVTGAQGIFVSRNYGNTWQNVTPLGPISAQWTSVSMSSDGRYQIATFQGGSPWVSSDFGGTWTNRSYTTSNWIAAALNSDGKYAFMFDGSTSLFPLQKIYNSVSDDLIAGNLNVTGSVNYIQPYARMTIDAGTFPMNNSTEYIIPWTAEDEPFQDIIETSLTTDNFIIKKNGVYHVKVRFSCYDMFDASDYLRVRLRQSIGSSIGNASAGTLNTTLGWRFMGGTLLGNGEAYVEGETVLRLTPETTGIVYLAATVLGSGGSGNGNTTFFPYIDNAFGTQPFMEIRKVA